METTEGAPRRRPGPPPGSPKVPGSGRKKGTSNKVNIITREAIIREGAPFAFLCQVVRGAGLRGDRDEGGKRSLVYPTIEQRLKAAEILARKILPDLKATELTGAEGGPIATTQVADSPEAREAALRKLGALLRGDAPSSQPPPARPANAPAPATPPAHPAPVTTLLDSMPPPSEPRRANVLRLFGAKPPEAT